MANEKSLIGSSLSMPTMKNLFLEEGNGKNLTYSPLSIYVALGLLASGAKGETLNQLLWFLKSENLECLHSFCSQFMNSLNSILVNKLIWGNYGGLELSCVNSVLVEKSCVLNPKFKEVANSIFKAEARAVDFRFKANEVRLIVNQWVEQKTSGLIKDLIPEGLVDSDTKIVLVNALYFKGSWCPDQFDKGLTRNSGFYLLDGHSSVEVPFMFSGKENQYILCHDGFKVLKLPYKLQAQATVSTSSQQFSMYIVLPDERNGLGE
ncbi:serpin-Z2B-like [Papaver somniferum]|uniref:serpin-Z2B-like n=1 Tax=Papaver somniferum TaxID=3469 RepID=UPI000E6F560C|nr:serpin-Z2B-like [Papaver somniferum]